MSIWKYYYKGRLVHSYTAWKGGIRVYSNSQQRLAFYMIGACYERSLWK